jgi:hypothetical protein
LFFCVQVFQVKVYKNRKKANTNKVFHLECINRNAFSRSKLKTNVSVLFGLYEFFVRPFIKKKCFCLKVTSCAPLATIQKFQKAKSKKQKAKRAMVTRYYEDKSYVMASQVVVGDTMAGGLMRHDHKVLDAFEHDGHVFLGTKTIEYNMPVVIYKKYAKTDRITIFKRAGDASRHPGDLAMKAIQQSIDEEKKEVEEDKK